LLAISVITGVGIETRDLSVFPSWQASSFMYGGPLMIIISLAAIGAIAAKRTSIGGPLAIVSALLSLIFSIVGIALLGAPDAPQWVTLVDGIHLIVALAIIYFAMVILRQPIKAGSSPASA